MKSSDIDNELLDQAVAFAEMWGTEQNWPHVRDAYVAAILRERKALALRSRPASALPVVGETPAWADVIAERKRQVEKEGWTPEHDDAHKDGQIAAAAACYAIRHISHWASRPFRDTIWPWDFEWWKPTTPRRNLVKAGALILAEIERLDRADALIPSVQP